MKGIQCIKNNILVVVLLTMTTVSYAGNPVWMFTPLTQTSWILPTSFTITAQYSVMNQSHKTHSLALQPVAGISQVTGVGYCSNPFTLAYQQSCILNLQIDGSALGGNISNGPIVCDIGNQLQCYQPAIANQLSITLDSNGLVVGNSPLILDAGGAPGSLTITNNTSLTVTNIQANLTGTALDGNVTQDASDCLVLQPAQTCSLIFTPANTIVSLTSFPIVDDNTQSATGSIQVSSPYIIFLSSNSYHGDLGGLSVADSKCNIDPAKPSSGSAAGYTYKALLAGNNATTTGRSYYRTDGTTLIATATGGNLVGLSGLFTAISTDTSLVWTGSSSNTCNNWTSSAPSQNGDSGNSAASSSEYWFTSNRSCAALSRLYCVSQ
jgi:hypothetical protein